MAIRRKPERLTWLEQTLLELLEQLRLEELLQLEELERVQLEELERLQLAQLAQMELLVLQVLQEHKSYSLTEQRDSLSSCSDKLELIDSS